jgi:2-polyprenyl-6-methoxyphenol hydroxylase-like FAD-dependent oxidoreductase
MRDVLVIGGGIGGLTLALALHRARIPCRVFEAAPEMLPIGVGINVLPHATAELARLGVLDELLPLGVETREAAFYNRFGQHIYTEPLGRFAGHPAPQLSIHRGDLQRVLLETVRARMGAERVQLGWKCVGVEQDGGGVTVRFTAPDGSALAPQRGSAAIGCDGINSVVRKQLYPAEGEPHYTGVTMWRGVTRCAPFLTGATFVRAGWLVPGKLVAYPISGVAADARHVVNWLAEIETPQRSPRDWTRRGFVEDFIAPYADWHWPWLDVPALFAAADVILEYPMVDQEPLGRWSFGRVTLLGDAAHPMVPRGSNGAGQAILDARALADALHAHTEVDAALLAYDRLRVPLTADVVLTNRTNPPDAILRLVYERTGDRPFRAIEDVASPGELAAITERYKQIAGYSLEGSRPAGRRP